MLGFNKTKMNTKINDWQVLYKRYLVKWNSHNPSSYLQFVYRIVNIICLLHIGCTFWILSCYLDLELQSSERDCFFFCTVHILGQYLPFGLLVNLIDSHFVDLTIISFEISKTLQFAFLAQLFQTCSSLFYADSTELHVHFPFSFFFITSCIKDSFTIKLQSNDTFQ